MSLKETPNLEHLTIRRYGHLDVLNEVKHVAGYSAKLLGYLAYKSAEFTLDLTDALVESSKPVDRTSEN